MRQYNFSGTRFVETTVAGQARPHRRTTMPMRSSVWTRSHILETGGDPGPGDQIPVLKIRPEYEVLVLPLGYKKLQFVTR